MTKRNRVRWLEGLTALPTAPGLESEIISWVRAWATNRQLRVKADPAGNLVVSVPGRSRRRPVVAVAHLDHPALVAKHVAGREVVAELRGGVHPHYLEGSKIESGKVTGRVVAFSGEGGEAVVSVSGEVEPGAILRWHFPTSAMGVDESRFRAVACDDLAGAAAALSALDEAQRQGIRHFSVLLTRAEEVGFIGAIAACELGTIPKVAAILSIECSRASAEAPLGGGPVVRVGDASSVFTASLTNAIEGIARARQLPHQRRLMSGGSCEATAFTALGWEATGLCLPLGNYHNMVDIDGVLAGRRKARLAPEEIALSDYHGLVDLLVAAADDLGTTSDQLPARIRRLYEEGRHILESAPPPGIT